MIIAIIGGEAKLDDHLEIKLFGDILTSGPKWKHQGNW